MVVYITTKPVMQPTVRPLKKFPAFCGTTRLFTLFTKARNRPLNQTNLTHNLLRHFRKFHFNVYAGTYA
jgi:hypothetical protein